MQFIPIPRQETIPTFDPTEYKVQLIENFAAGELPVPEALSLLKQRPFQTGLGWYLYLDPDGEGEFMEVLCDGTWLALGVSDGGTENYYSYNPAFTNVTEFTGLRSGGQSPVEKELALTDIDAGIRAVEYFIHTGQLYPGIDWAKQL